MTARSCAVCDKPLEGRQRGYCSAAHRAAASRDGLEEARANEAARFDTNRTCQNCGTSLAGSRRGALTCSSACRNARAKAKAALWPVLAGLLERAHDRRQPRYVLPPDEERFFSKVREVPDSGHGLGECWEWTGSKNGGGYGQASRDGRKVDSHRLAYEMFVGPLPDGYVADHLCSNRGCCNPVHLEAVTVRENLLRGNSPAARNARKTHCDHGHALEGENVYRYEREPGKFRRDCKACKREALRRFLERHPEYREKNIRYQREYRRKKRAERQAVAA